MKADLVAHARKGFNRERLVRNIFVGAPYATMQWCRSKELKRQKVGPVHAAPAAAEEVRAATVVHRPYSPSIDITNTTAEPTIIVGLTRRG